MLERGLTQIGVNASAQALGNYGAGVNVGIFDTPVDERHNSLNVTGSIDLHIYSDYVYSGHGTHVAGTIGGMNGTGVATRANLFDVSVLSPAGYWASGVTLGNAMAAARDAGVSIANMSFGYADGYVLDLDQYSAIRENRHNMLVVKSAGNDGVALMSVQTEAGGYGALQNFMLVGSVDDNNEISEFSNRPGSGCFARRLTVKSGGRKRTKWACKSSDQYKNFFIVAPGENIRSTVPGGGTAIASGTSMAAPHVAGAAALLQGRWAHLKERPQATANILFKSATDLGKKGVDGVYGWGLLNVEKAFQPIGETYLFSTKKKLPSGTTGLRSTGRLSKMIGWNSKINALSVFDEFDRNFTVATAGLATNPEPQMATRMSGLISSFSNPALEAVTATRSLPFADSMTLNYGLSSAREAELGFASPSPELGVDRYLNETSGGQSGAAWFFELKEDSGNWSVFSGGSDQRASPFAFTQMNDGDASAMTSSGNIENPVLGLVKDATYMGSRFAIGSGIELMFGRTEGIGEEFVTTTYETAATVAGLRINPVENLYFGVTATQLSEENGLFGAVGSGGLSLGENFRTDALTVSTQYSPAENWVVSAAYTLAQTSQDGPSDLFKLSGTMLSDASAIALTRHNLLAFGDRMSLTASLPLATISGEATSQLASHYDAEGNMVYQTYTHDLAEADRPVELSLGYTSPVGPGVVRLGIAAELNERSTGKEEFGGFAAYSFRF